MHMVKTRIDGVNHIAFLWDSATEPGKHAATLKRESQRALAYADGSYKRGNHDLWFGASSLEEMQQRFDKGWPEGAERLQSIAVREINPTSVRRRRSRSDQGDEVDMQAIWRGDLSRAWTRTRRQARAGTNRSVTICVQLSDSCAVDATQLFWRGASALKLADALVAAGYNVTIVGAMGTRGGNEGRKKLEVSQFVEIKASDSPLDLSALAALTAMPAWMRTQGFAGIVAGCDQIDADHESGLGIPDSRVLKQGADLLGMTGMIIQPVIRDQAAAEQWIDKVLEQIDESVPLAA